MLFSFFAISIKMSISCMQYKASSGHRSIHALLIGGPSDDDSWIVLPQFCTHLHNLGDGYIRSVYQFSPDIASLLLSFNPWSSQLLSSLSVIYVDWDGIYAFESLPSCIHCDVFRSLYMYVLVNVHGWLYAMMTESERVTWWFRDFDEGGENQSCCIMPSNRIYGGVASQFHLYPCDYTCPLFPLLQHLLWNVAAWNRRINAMKECNCNSCGWVAFMTYRAFYDEVLVVHSVKWITRICSLCQFSLRVNLCSMTSVLILWYINCLLIRVECW